jgi:hypothetical protein
MSRAQTNGTGKRPSSSRVSVSRRAGCAADLRRVDGVRPLAHQAHDGGVVAAVADAGGRQRAVQLHFDAPHLFQHSTFAQRLTNRAAARMGPTVWELDGPMPILNRSKTLIAIAHSSSISTARLERSCYAQDRPDGGIIGLFRPPGV